jgi:hypothetical protein
VTPARWDWERERGPARLAAELAGDGISWVRAPELVEAAERDPWGAAERLLGERALLVERQPIRAVPGGRSFASTRGEAPLHSDSQMLLGVPPQVQVMACRAAAAAGGEGVYLDTWALLAGVEREAPDLLARLFTEPRRQPFVFGDVFGPTVSLRGGSLVFTHTPRPAAGDSVAARLQPLIEAAPIVEVRAAPGDLVVMHNHRYLHGRRAFEDDSRSFTRLLVWRRHAWPAPPRWTARAEAAAGDLRERLADAPLEVQEAYGVAVRVSEDVVRQIGMVIELLRGVPAGVISGREGISEPDLYRLRDRTLRGAASGPEQRAPDDRALQGVLDVLRRGEGQGTNE